jgi:hypothetical protein
MRHRRFAVWLMSISMMTAVLTGGLMSGGGMSSGGALMWPWHTSGAVVASAATVPGISMVSSGDVGSTSTQQLPASGVQGTSNVQSTSGVHSTSNVHSQGTQATQEYAKGFHGFSRPSTRHYSSYGSGYSYTRPYGGFGSHLFSFGAGYMLGSFFHPFGGYYGFGGMYGYHHFSIIGFLFDILILYIIWRVIRAFFRRR